MEGGGAQSQDYPIITGHRERVGGGITEEGDPGSGGRGRGVVG